MATFKVGQRVKSIYQGANCTVRFGAEGVVEGLGGIVWPSGYMVRFDRDSDVTSTNPCNCREDTLAPLTDPRAEEFIADMERYAHIAKEKNVKEPA